jgi:hypothetical protein
MVRIYFVLSLISVFIFSCEQKPKQEVQKELEAESFEEVVFFKSVDDCQMGNADCSYYKITYPNFTGKNAAQLNEQMRQIKSPAFDPDRRLEPLEDQAAEFLNEYVSYSTDYPNEPYAWYINHQVKVLSENNEVILISSEIAEYGGGAHPNFAVIYYNMVKSTGHIIKLEELYDLSQQSTISTLLSTQIDPDISLFSPTISPNENFILKGDSITFVFNPYEIAPYSEGVIRLTLPRNVQLNM